MNSSFIASLSAHTGRIHRIASWKNERLALALAYSVGADKKLVILNLSEISIKNSSYSLSVEATAIAAIDTDTLGLGFIESGTT